MKIRWSRFAAAIISSLDLAGTPTLVWSLPSMSRGYKQIQWVITSRLTSLYLVEEGVVLPLLVVCVFKLVHLKFETLDVCFEEFVG